MSSGSEERGVSTVRSECLASDVSLAGDAASSAPPNSPPSWKPFFFRSPTASWNLGAWTWLNLFRRFRAALELVGLMMKVLVLARQDHESTNKGVWENYKCPVCLFFFFFPKTSRGILLIYPSNISQTGSSAAVGHFLPSTAAHRSTAPQDTYKLRSFESQKGRNGPSRLSGPDSLHLRSNFAPPCI